MERQYLLSIASLLYDKQIITYHPQSKSIMLYDVYYHAGEPICLGYINNGHYVGIRPNKL